MASAPPRPSFDPDAPNDPAVEAAFEAAPETVVAEILDGELHTMARPHPRHARAAGQMLRRLGSFDDDPGDPGGWTILIEPELHLGAKPDKLVPDLAGWRRPRLPASAFDDAAPAGIPVAPDWVCEVISPSTERIDRGKKMRIYRREHVGHVWLANPVAETLEVYRREGDNWLLVDTFEGDATVRAQPFDAIELALAPIWGR